MLSEDQVQNEVLALKREFQRQIPIWLNEAIEKLAIKIIPKQQLDQVRQDMGIKNSETKLQFLNAFPQAFLRKITNQNNIDEVKTVQQLLLFGQGFCKEDMPVVKKTQILKDIINELNQKIQMFFRDCKLQIVSLSKQEKQLKEQILKQGRTPQHVYDFIRKDQEQRKQIPKIEEKKIEEKVHEHLPSLPQVVIQNIVPTEEGCPHCLCSKSLNNIPGFGQRVNSPIVKCRVCENQYHTACLKITSSSQFAQFVCPECVILRLDPLHKIIDIICQPVPFRPTQHAPAKTFTFILGEQDASKQVELRCIKLDGKSGAEEPTWPDIGEISLNENRLLEFKPLQNNSSLKKRKDEKLTTRELKYKASNVIQIREGTPNGEQKMNCRVQLGQVYFVGLFLIQALSSQQLINEIIARDQSWMCIEDCKDNIRLYMHRCSTTDIHVQSLSVNLTCIFDTRLIETPVRGNLCEHVQCFSLESMIQMMYKLNPRRWRCPICRSKCFDFVIDSYQLYILKLIKANQLTLSECNFNIKGDIEQSELTSLVNWETIGSHLPHQGIENDNKFIQLEWLRQNNHRADQSSKRNDHVQKKQNLDDVPSKKQQPNNQKFVVQYLDRAQSMISKIIQGYSGAKELNKNPIFID